MGIKTIEEAQKLPEKSFCEYEEIIIEKFDKRFPDAKIGDCVHVPRSRKLVVYNHEQDDIILFRDKDGTVMAVVYYLEGGPFKMKA